MKPQKVESAVTEMGVKATTPLETNSRRTLKLLSFNDKFYLYLDKGIL